MEFDEITTIQNCIERYSSANSNPISTYVATKKLKYDKYLANSKKVN